MRSEWPMQWGSGSGTLAELTTAGETRQAGAPGWWQQYSDILPKWFELYIGLEKAASIIRTYEVQFVHGLMQTEDYARAVILIANAHAPAEEIDRRVSVRMKRQQLLTQ